jgi:hypothetical protein
MLDIASAIVLPSGPLAARPRRARVARQDHRHAPASPREALVEAILPALMRPRGLVILGRPRLRRHARGGRGIGPTGGSAGADPGDERLLPSAGRGRDELARDADR